MGDPIFVSLKPGSTWLGRDVRTPTGQALHRLVNGYVSSDGREIRRMPGYKVVVNNEVAPAWQTLFPISVRVPSGGGWTPHYSFVRKRRLHCFAQVRDRLLIVGEGDFPKQPVHGVGGSIEVTVTAWDDPGNWIQLSANPKPYTDPYGIGVSTTSATFGAGVGDFLWIEGTGNAELDNAFHRVASVQVDTPAPGVARIVLDLSWTNLSTSGSASAGARLYRVSRGGLVNGNQVSTKEPDSLVVWTGITNPSMTAPMTTPNVAQIASRNPDYGDEIEFAAGWTHGAGSLSRRKATTIPRRLNPEVSGDRLLLAAPGLGCVLQAPVIVPTAGGWIQPPDLPNNIHDQPRSLGVPKAVLFDPTTKDPVLTPPNAGTYQGPTNGTYRVRVAYRDDGTGEVGLPSEEATYSITGQILRLAVLHPAYLMGETAATSVLVYITGPNGSVTALFRTVAKESQAYWATYVGANAATFRYGGKPSNTNPFSQVILGHIYLIIDVAVDTAVYGRAFSANTDIDFDRLPDEIPQMPMGCRAVRTIRGVTLFGGHHGNQGEAYHLQRGTASSILVLPEPTPAGNRNGRSESEIATRNLDLGATTLDGGFGVGSGAIPPAYQGQELVCVEGTGESILEDEMAAVRVDKLLNSYAKWDGISVYETPWAQALRYAITTRPLRTNRTKTGKAVHLLLPRGSVQWSEPGAPGAVPAVNTTWVDAEQDEDVIAIGRLGEAAIICTQTQTHAFSWRRGPGGASPTLLSSEFGCIATNSMIEFDRGLAWLSERGPVASFGGEPLWVGEPVGRDFIGAAARYLRDGQGQMPHSWAAHDRQRKLVYFGLRVSTTGDTVEDYPSRANLTWEQAGHDLKSKFPCDEVLIWSYTTNAWSTWVPHLSIHWMDELKFDDGVHRMCFLASDSRIYALDDAYGAGWDMHTTAVAQSPGTNSNVFTATAAAFYDGIPQDGWTRPGMPFYIFSPTEGPSGSAPNGGIRGSGTIVSVDSTLQVTLSTNLTWKAGDVIVIGAPEMELDFQVQTSHQRDRHAVTAVNAEHSLHTFLSATGAWPAGWSGTPPRAWMSATVETEAGDDPLESPTVNKAGRTEFLGDRALAGGDQDDREFTTTARVPRGRVRGLASRLKLTFRGAAQVRLTNVGLEVVEA